MLFQSSPKPFDERDGTDFPYGAETVHDAELFEAVEKLFRDELAPLIGNEVTRSSETLDGGLEKSEDGLCGWFLQEDTRGPLCL